MLKYYFLGIILFSFQGFLQGQKNGKEVFDPNFLHEVRIYFDEPGFFDTMVYNYETFYGGDIPYLMGRIEIDGQVVDSIGARFKGFTSYIDGIAKKPIKIDFNEFVDGQRLDGLRKLNLNVSFGDPTFLREVVSYEILRKKGIPAPRTSFAKVYINDTYWGLYQMVEQIDRSFLDNYYSDNDGNLFKNIDFSKLEWKGFDPLDYQPPFELKTNEEENDWSNFIALIDFLNNAPDELFYSKIDSVFNVSGFLDVLAIDVILNNWDSYVLHGRNFYLYEEWESNRFHWLPWDYNLSLGAGGVGVIGGLCELEADFVGFTNGTAEVEFRNISDYDRDVTFLWDFGDGNFSNEKEPLHEYGNAGEYEVCLTVTADDKCFDQKCWNVATSFSPAMCNSVSNGSLPYEPDFIFQRVLYERESCCDFWGGLCEVSYERVKKKLAGFNPIELKIDQRDNSGVLVRRLLQDSIYFQQYLMNICNTLTTVIDTAKLFATMDWNRSLIEDALIMDENALYSYNQYLDQMENETVEGSLKNYIVSRIDTLMIEISNYTGCMEYSDTIPYQSITINEIMASNTPTSGISDDEGEYDDWIELYNNTDKTISLDGFYLTDDLWRTRKWAFPNNTQIGAGEFLIVWADEDEPGVGLHSNFKLDKDGEFIALINEQGVIQDSISFGEQTSNFSFARNPNGTGPFVFQDPTFGYSNSASSISIFEVMEDLEIYPNPTINEIIIQFPENIEIETDYVEVYNIWGNLVHSEGIIGNKLELDISHLDNGLYFIQIQTSTNTIFTGKIEKFGL